MFKYFKFQLFFMFFERAYILYSGYIYQKNLIYNHYIGYIPNIIYKLYIK